MKRFFIAALPHFCAVFALAALIVCIVDGVNSQMGFLASTCGRILLIVASLFSMLLAIREILREHGG